MQYLLEETAVLDGLMRAYFTSPQLSESLRQDYQTVHQHMESNELTRADYRKIHSAAQFFLPLLESSPAEYRLMVSVLTKTSSMLAKS